ncbi:hypothetical protein HFP57_13590 [Parasphingopyxis algicola]|uniref:hypothetical protein n=1 Tax=Parasphingopyxis algicola TaxID=2026624 RepID=UPI0015A2B3DA|nr:hypothetical protein [Parasphingopyxis algicola]QLC25954.1 hypothetical protein HFP57_13590 [Parasphingopyxis algicola]
MISTEKQRLEELEAGMFQSINLIAIISALTTLLASALIVGRISYFFATLRARLNARRLSSQMDQAVFAGPFSKGALKASFLTYVEPDCSPTDPSNESDLRYTADVRERIFKVVDRYVEVSGRRKHLMILADSGMGKTSFCLNYFLHAQKKFTPEHHVALVSLAHPECMEYIAAIKNKRNTILLLDALDENSEAIVNYNEKLSEILIAATDYLVVIVTCRSQFFEDQDHIPVDTGVSMLVPRKGGESATYKIPVYPLDARVDCPYTAGYGQQEKPLCLT